MASGSDGLYLPVSIALTVCRETPRMAPRSAWDMPFSTRKTRTSFRTVSSVLYTSIRCQASLTLRVSASLPSSRQDAQVPPSKYSLTSAYVNQIRLASTLDDHRYLISDGYVLATSPWTRGPFRLAGRVTVYREERSMPEMRRRDLFKTAGVIGGASLITIGGRSVAAVAQPGASTIRPVDITAALDVVTVFERGETDDYHTFRIPVFVLATDGTLLAFAQGRVESPSDFGHAQLVLKRSADGGETWSELQVVAADPPNRVANQSVAVDQMTGRIHVFVVRTGGDVTGDEIVNDTVSPEDAPRPFVLHSDDHGATWSEWREITDDVKLPPMRHYVGGPTHGIQLTRGPHAAVSARMPLIEDRSGRSGRRSATSASISLATRTAPAYAVATGTDAAERRFGNKPGGSLDEN